MAKKEELFKTYLKDIYKTSRAKDSTELSYYPDLKKFLAALAGDLGKKVTVISSPRKKGPNMPDFAIRDKDGNPVGYIEAKPPEQEDLQAIYDSDQLKRYREDLDNLILTNFLEFWLIRYGKVVAKVQVGGQRLLEAKITPVPTHAEEAVQLLDQFLSFIIPETASAKELAIELAKRTRFLRTQVRDELSGGNKALEGLLEAFKEALIPDLNEDRFADLFAQTISYGLLAARIRTKERFKREHADEYIPRSIGVLRRLFQYISSEDLPYALVNAADEISGVLDKADVKRLFDEYYRKGKGDDPLYHFYETFLKEYGAETRKKLGVFYTPAPVVSYITRSINHLLKEKFGKEDGFATTGVTVLDPAAGTMTFPAQAIRLAKKEADKHGSGMWRSVAKDHILKDFYAFELLMAPYAIGHIKMSLLLGELGYEIPKDDKFKLYLTNTLDPEEVEATKLPGMRELSEESRDAAKVKKEIPILVIMGNPPYSASKSSGTEFINEKMKDYMTGLEVEKEKKKGAIQDDYVRFIRFAHWKIEEAGQGILAFITNNSYLDGLVHRSMRKQLLDTFDEIYILNLHGNARIGETAPDGSKDENVFDIQQGVVIALFAKTGKERKESKILYHDAWRTRKEKYKYLEKNDVTTTKWQEIKPRERFYFFTPRDYTLQSKWDSWLRLDQIFDQYVSGIESQKDNICVNWGRKDAERIIENLVSKLPDDIVKTTYQIKDSRDWKLREVRKFLRKSVDKDKTTQMLYRPFDLRWTYFDDYFLAYPRKPLMNSLVKRGNVAILAMREYLHEAPYSHALVTNVVVDRRVFLSNRGAAYVFPLNASQAEPGQKDLFGRVLSTNFHLSFWDWFEKNVPSLGAGTDPWWIFQYIYAILYSNIYREKYLEFLKSEFPRIPFTNDPKLFMKLAKRGDQLMDLHLLKSPELDNPIVGFNGEGSGKVEKIEYRTVSKPTVGMLSSPSAKLLTKSTRKIGFVMINDKQSFGPIEPEVWEYYIGGYQVLSKWLKDRKGRELSADDIKHYCKIVTALAKTIEIQKEIDKLYLEVEKSLI